MATTVNELVTKVRVTGADQYVQQMHRMAASQSAFAGRVVHAGLAATAIGLGAVSLAATALGVSSVKAAVEFDGLLRGLTAVMGSAAAARRELVRLEEVAKLPGLGFAEALQGATQFMAAGFTASGAERAMIAFGNALATVGRGKADFQLVALALTQIATKARVSGEEIRQLSERVPQIRRIMLQAFGTADTEELARRGVKPEEFLGAIITELEKMPRVTGGARNAFENFSDAFWRFRVSIGTGLLRVLEPVANALGGLFDRFVKGGQIESVVASFMRMIDVKAVVDAVQKGFVGIIAVIKTMPTWLRNIGLWFQNSFGPIRIMLAGIAATLAVMFAFSAIKGIVEFGKAIALLAIGLARVVGTLVTATVLSGQFGQAAAAVAAGVVAAAVLAYGAGKVRDSFNALATAFGTSELKKNYGELMGMFGGAPGGLPDALARTGGEAIMESLPGGASVATEIARNTRQTADNTKPFAEWSRRIFGGGDLGQIGVTPVEVAMFGRSRGNAVNINIYGGDVAAIERTVLNLRRRGLV